MSTKKEHISMFGDKQLNAKLLKISLPIVLQNLMLALVAAADALMLGTIRQDAMSAVSLATQIQFVQNMILFAVVEAMTALGAQYWGRKDTRTVGDVLCIGLRINGVVSVLTFILCVFAPTLGMRIFTNEPVLIELGARYLRIAGWSYLMTGISQCYLAVLKVSEHPGDAALISSVTVILNIVLNAVFIYGLAGVPRLEERGAAVATLIARAVELVWAIALSLKKGYIHPKPRALITVHKLLSRDFAVCVLPLMGAGCLWGVGFTAYSAFMGHLGTDAAGANSVAAVVRDLVCCLCNGLGTAGGIVVGNELGAGRLQEGKTAGIRVMKMGFLCGFASTAIMLAVTPALLAMVKLTDGAQELLLGMMVIMAFYMIGRAVNTVIINGLFASGGDTKFDMYSLAVVMWGLAVPLAALGTFVFHWHPLVVYGMTCLDEVGKIPWVMLHFKKYKWVKDLTRDAEKA